MSHEEFEDSCQLRTCDWLKRGGLYCAKSTKSGCRKPDFLEADESDFHDRRLIEATQAIKGIIEGLGENPDGRKLSLVETNMGILLAWVEHTGGDKADLKTLSPEGYNVDLPTVTADDDDSVVAHALGLHM